MEKVPLVSFIIPTFNSGATITRCLRSIHQLDYPPEKIEVIVVDNGSTDTTIRLAEQHGAQVLIRPNVFVSELRNIGAEEAKGEVLAFVDSDCLVSPLWLKNALQHLQRPSVAAAGCGYALPSPPSWIEQYWFYLHISPPNRVSYVPAGNMLIRKALFKDASGFNSQLETGEDSEFCLRLRNMGFVIISDPAIKNVHLGNPKTLGQFFRKELWHGKGLVACISGHNWTDRTFLLTNIFLTGFLVLLLGVVCYFLLQKALPIYIGAAAIGFVVIISTAFRSLRRRTLYSLPYLLVLNISYYLARSICLLTIYQDILRKALVRFKRRQPASSR